MQKREFIEKVVLSKEDNDYYQQLRKQLKLSGTEQPFEYKKNFNVPKKRYRSSLK